MSALGSLVNLVKLDLERCPGIGGGLVHLKGIFYLNGNLFRLQSKIFYL